MNTFRLQIVGKSLCKPYKYLFILLYIIPSLDVHMDSLFVNAPTLRVRVRQHKQKTPKYSSDVSQLLN